MLTDASPDNLVRVGGLSPSSLREKLKAATAAAHRALDARFGSFDLTGMIGYRRFLEASAAALLPLEAALEHAGIAEVFPDWPQRSRRAAIVADLDRIGGVAMRLPSMSLMNRHDMLGAMYVLEGSRLGAKYLLRAVDGCEPQIVSATNYLRHGNGLPLWRTFLEILEREPVTPDDLSEMISGARGAFAMFARAAAA